VMPKQLCGLRMLMMMCMGAAYSTAMIVNGPKPLKIRLRGSSEVTTGPARKAHKVVFGWVMNEAVDDIHLYHSWVLILIVNQALYSAVLKSRTLSLRVATRTVMIGVALRAVS
jgi:hypothetical protein